MRPCFPPISGIEINCRLVYCVIRVSSDTSSYYQVQDDPDVNVNRSLECAQFVLIANHLNLISKTNYVVLLISFKVGWGGDKLVPQHDAVFDCFFKSASRN